VFRIGKWLCHTIILVVASIFFTDDILCALRSEG
jgi:hypothetical protein